MWSYLLEQIYGSAKVHLGSRPFSMRQLRQASAQIFNNLINRTPNRLKQTNGSMLEFFRKHPSFSFGHQNFLQS